MIINYLKNIFKSTIHDIKVSDEIYCAFIHNGSGLTETIQKPVSRKYIQLYFCMNGNLSIQIDQKKIICNAMESVFIYNPLRDMPINLNISKECKALSIFITIDALYSLFSAQIHLVPFLSDENINSPLEYLQPIDNKILPLFDSFEKYELHESFKSMFYHAKTTELLIYYFNIPNEKNNKSLSFLQDEHQVYKIKEAKEIMLQNINKPLTIKELAESVSISEFKLKEGFKKIYNQTLYSYLLDQRMNYSKKLLATKKYNVQEVAYQVGYENPSHFIVAFKKKFGITPKKYSS